MPCGSTTGQCFDYPPPGTTCGSTVSEEGQCPTCCYPFSSVFGFPEESTAGRLNGCFVGIFQDGNSAGREIADGRWCSFGCNGSDVADFMDQSDNTMADLCDNRNGHRWMKPWQEPYNARARDAHGMFHDLRSNQYHPVPWHTEWTRGVCWWNREEGWETGRECFDDDVCKCWHKGDYFDHSPQGGTPCRDFQTGDAVYTYEPLPFVLPDYAFRTGYGWPPGVLEGGRDVRGNEWYCRRFKDTRVRDSKVRNKALLSAPPVGGPGDLVEPVPGLVHASYNAMHSNPMAFCAARIEKPHVACETSVWYISGGHEPGGPIYYNETPSRFHFDGLLMDWATDDPIHIRVCEHATELQRTSAELKGRILQAVLLDGLLGDDFGELTHLIVAPGTISNVNLGHYLKTWTGRVEMPNVFGPCHLQQSRLPVTCRLYVTYVEVAAQVVMLQTRDSERTRTQLQINPHARLSVAIGLETEAELSEGATMETWDGRAIALELDDLRVVGDLDTIEYRDLHLAAKLFKPPSVVEWRGFLGHSSRPWTTHDHVMERDLLQNQPVCETMIVHFDGKVPGWPMFADSRPDNPTGLYGGWVGIKFRQFAA